MNPELVALLRKSMHMTDEELAALAQGSEELEALLDVVFDPDSLAPSHAGVERTRLRRPSVD
jgi:hypothetical protein